MKANVTERVIFGLKEKRQRTRFQGSSVVCMVPEDTVRWMIRDH